MEMGCGKSKVLIDNIAWLYEKAEIDCAIIVAPKGVYMNWKNSEIPIHLHDSIRHKVYVWKSSLTKKKRKCSVNRWSRDIDLESFSSMLRLLLQRKCCSI